MAREDLHFRLRIPEELKAKVEAAAEANMRSMTAEIVARLEASFDRPLKSKITDGTKELEFIGETMREQADLINNLVVRLTDAQEVISMYKSYIDKKISEN